jgi:sterol desaturase/sphingolipid hydroxylase (fatty acid hydroxylase superfamily)
MSEPGIRLGLFIAVFTAMALWEAFRPWRQRRQERALRWSGNLGVLLIDIVLVRLLFPLGGVGVALSAEQAGYGLFHMVALPFWLAVLASFIALDGLIYWQHRLFHMIPLFWRLHRMHHADTELDVTSGLRFHPVEILLSMLIKSAAIILLGAPALAVILFEIALNATSMFNHANVRIPDRLEPVLRWIVVTPRMHLVHHSIEKTETNSNFGFNLPWWDRTFGSYTPEPRLGYEGMTIGLDSFRNDGEQRLDRLLTQPLREPGASP